MPCTSLFGILEDRLHLEDEPVVGLVGGMLPQALRLDHHPGVRALRERVDGQHRRAEVGDVDPPLEVARDRGLEEVDHQRAALLADVDAGRAVGQVDDEPAFAIAAAAEVDVAQRVLRLGGLRLGEALHGLLARADRLLVGQRHDHRAAFDRGLERLRLVEVEHDARAVAGLDDVEAAQRGFVDRALRRAEAVGGVEEVERDPRRARDGEGGRADWPAGP